MPDNTAPPTPLRAQTPARQFVAFVDDSGEKEYGENTSRYFVYAAVIADEQATEHLTARVRDIKQRRFGTADVEIKSNWLRIPRERKRRYLDGLGTTNDDVDAAVEEFYAVLQSPEITLAASVIDKMQMKEKYGAHAWHPSATAYQFFLQRYQHFLANRGHGKVLIDNMTGASPAANQWRDLIATQHRRLKRDGCSITGLRFDAVLPGPTFADSSRVDLLQLADLVAYNVFRQFRDHGSEWDRPTGSLPQYPPFGMIVPRFYGAPAELDGYGLVKFPRVTRPGLRWRPGRKE